MKRDNERAAIENDDGEAFRYDKKYEERDEESKREGEKERRRDYQKNA